MIIKKSKYMHVKLPDLIPVAVPNISERHSYAFLGNCLYRCVLAYFHMMFMICQYKRLTVG